MAKHPTDGTADDTSVDLLPPAPPKRVRGASGAEPAGPPAGTDPPSAAASAGGDGDAPNGAGAARRWLGLMVIAVSQLMIVLDATIVNVALPAMSADLEISEADRQWVVTAYTLAFGGLLLLGGRLADYIGRRQTFIIGLIGFAFASALGGAATNLATLLTARAAQGVFGALLAPAALALVTTMFREPNERAKAFAIFGAVAGGGSAIGLVLGGVLTEYLSWRWTMYVNIPIALLAMMGAFAVLPVTKEKATGRIDIIGAVLGTAGLLAIVYGFSEAERKGWTDPSTLTFLGSGFALLIMFVTSQRFVENPLLPLRVLASRTRAGANIAVLLGMVAMFGVFFFLSFYMQGVLGFKPVKTGVAFLPITGGIIVASAVVSAIATKVSPRLLMGVGLFGSALAMFLLVGIEPDSSYAADLLPALILIGLSLGCVFVPAFNAATIGVEATDAGVASATVNTSQQVGGSLGIALLATVATNHSAEWLTGREINQETMIAAQVEGYARASLWAGLILVGAAVITILLVNVRRLELTGFGEGAVPIAPAGPPAAAEPAAAGAEALDPHAAPGRVAQVPPESGHEVAPAPAAGPEPVEPAVLPVPVVPVGAPDPWGPVPGVPVTDDVPGAEPVGTPLAGEPNGMPRAGERVAVPVPGSGVGSVPAPQAGAESVPAAEAEPVGLPGVSGPGVPGPGVPGPGVPVAAAAPGAEPGEVSVPGAERLGGPDPGMPGEVSVPGAVPGVGAVPASQAEPVVTSGAGDSRAQTAVHHVCGRVRQGTGAAVAGAALTLLDSAGRQVARGTSDAGGGFAFAVPGPEEFVLVARRAGHRPHAITVLAKAWPEDVEVVLAGSASLLGTVVASWRRTPVRGALVTLADPAGDVVASVRTDDAGEYEIAGLAGGTFTLVVTTPASRPVALLVEVGQDGRTRQDVEVAGSASLGGVARTPEGRIIVDARVTLSDPDGRVVAEAFTGEDGRYEFVDLVEGNYTLLAEGYPPSADGVIVDAAQAVVHEITLSHSTVRIESRDQV